MLVLACVFGVVGSASAVKWLTDTSDRVGAMGGINLAVEDETTAITPFNHENLAGLALNSRMNRLDLGLVYQSQVSELSGYGKDTMTDMELTRPGAEYRGLTYWLNDSFVARIGVEAISMSSASSPTGGTEQKLNFSGLGGGVSAAYLFDFGLALGAGVTYTGAGGKPDPLPEVFPGTAATKAELTANNMNWGIGAAYAMAAGEGNKLSLGFQAGADDDRPTMPSSVSLSSLGNIAFGDYNGVIDVVVPVPLAGNASMKTTFTNTPMKLSGEAIFDMGKMLSAGILFDSKTVEQKTKSESVDPTGGFLGLPPDFDGKTAASSIMGISPVIRATLPLGEGLNLLPGLMYTTYGSGNYDTYYPNGATTSYKAATSKVTMGTVNIGLGLQAMSKQLQLGAQLASGSSKSEQTAYAPDGSTLGTATSPDSNLMAIGFGAEYWVMPVFALRAGYNTTTYTTKYTSGDQKLMAGTITLGAGLASPEGMAVDLLVKLATYTSDPAPSPAPTNTGTGIFLGGRIPL